MFSTETYGQDLLWLKFAGTKAPAIFYKIKIIDGVIEIKETPVI